jgi:hypothetical protein
VLERARRRIAELPPQYHEVYGDALALLEAGARQQGSYVDHQRRELGCSATSALSPIGKGAYAFFYLRQIAAERACGPTRNDGATATLACDAVDADARRFADDLRRRKLPGFALAEHAVAGFRLVGTRGRAQSNGAAHDVAIRLAPSVAPEVDVELYAPAYRAGSRLVELAIRPAEQRGADRDAMACLARTLQRFGFEVARTAPGRIFVTNRLLAAYLAPLARYVLRGGDIGVLNGELRRFGFVERPHDLLTKLDRSGLVLLLAPALGESPSTVEAALEALATERWTDANDPVVLDAVCVSLLDAVLTARAEREVSDTTIVDLIARELLDFPRHLCSLASWLKTTRVATAIGHGPVRALVPDAALASARAFVAGGREFYR